MMTEHRPLNYIPTLVKRQIKRQKSIIRRGIVDMNPYCLINDEAESYQLMK